MTTVGLIVSALALTLVAVREAGRLRTGGATPYRLRHLDRALVPGVLLWAAVVAAQLADYLA